MSFLTVLAPRRAFLKTNEEFHKSPARMDPEAQSDESPQRPSWEWGSPLKICQNSQCGEIARGKGSRLPEPWRPAESSPIHTNERARAGHAASSSWFRRLYLTAPCCPCSEAISRNCASSWRPPEQHSRKDQQQLPTFDCPCFAVGLHSCQNSLKSNSQGQLESSSEDVGHQPHQSWAKDLAGDRTLASASMGSEAGTATSSASPSETPPKLSVSRSHS